MKRIFVYILNSIVGFIWDGQVHAHKCYVVAKNGILVRAYFLGHLHIYSELLTGDPIMELLLELLFREYCPYKPFHGLWQGLMGVLWDDLWYIFRSQSGDQSSEGSRKTEQVCGWSHNGWDLAWNSNFWLSCHGWLLVWIHPIVRDFISHLRSVWALAA
jgi:hypothetical protein